ncbi:MAG: capsule biosynthesis protein CapA [Gracilibacter sp. BRH_c7a]|nr:MAG: capsule biosynthesis protein CapA [Gracilibacter sp. BRH_c7a]
MSKNRKRVLLILSFPILLFVIYWKLSPLTIPLQEPISPATPDITSITPTEISSEISPNESINIKLTFLGDIMCHPTQYEAAKTPDGYDFSPSFEDIKEYTSKADLTLANLETALAGKEKIYSGYPSFNTPEQLAYAIKDTLGVDVVSTANNHSLDRHYSGLCNTIDFLDNSGLKHTGTFKTEEESKEILITDVKGLKIAFLSYTYGTNGVKLPQDKPFAVNYINRDKILLDAQKARELGSHLIVASLHWGEEYSHTPSEQQVSLANWIFENTEVDIISGNHVHAVQPIEFINVSKDNISHDREGLVVYAQGNFFSNQQTKSANRGIITDIDLKFNPIDNDVSIENVYYTPIWIDETVGSGPQTYRVLNVDSALRNFLQSQDELLDENDYNKMLEFVSLVERVISPGEKINSTSDLAN